MAGGPGLLGALKNSFSSKSADDPMGIYKENGKLKVGKAEKYQLASDYKRLQDDPNSFGISDEEKEKMAAEATQTAGQQNQAIAGDLAQTALAGQGFQAGALEQAGQGLGEGAADAAVKARTGINDLSSRMIQGEKDRIAAQTHAERLSKKEEAKFWATYGVDSVAKLVSSVGGAVNPT
jgi:hypothetical protein